jgi:Zn finger protein HypA/HybF involved in hydrogenase expression
MTPNDTKAERCPGCGRSVSERTLQALGGCPWCQDGDLDE